MITNPGFSFSGISGTHKIVPVNETDLPSWGENYCECIVCTYDGELVKVYDNGPGFSYLDKSVAMEFAAIDITDRNAILQFCNRYPPLWKELKNVFRPYFTEAGIRL